MTLANAGKHGIRGTFSRMKGIVTRETAPGALALNPEEAWHLYDAKARHHLGMSAEEFERAWKRGDFRGRQEDPDVRRVVMVRTKNPNA